MIAASAGSAPSIPRVKIATNYRELDVETRWIFEIYLRHAV